MSYQTKSLVRLSKAVERFPIMEDHAAEVVKDAPTLSAERKARLARLLRFKEADLDRCMRRVPTVGGAR